MRGEFEASLVTVIEPVTLPAVVGRNVAVNVAVPPGFTVAGVVIPLAVNPVPAAVMLEILTAVFPEFVSTTCLGTLVPVATVPKLTLVGFAVSWPTAAFAVPLRAIVRVELEASLLTVIAPVSLPAVVGLKFAVSVAVCDAFRVAGVVRPLTEKPVPVAATLEIFTAALPALVRTICCELLLPVVTVPKLTLAGLADSWPTGTDEPVPLRATVMLGLFGSLLVTVTLPLALPAVVGEKLMVA